MPQSHPEHGTRQSLPVPTFAIPPKAPESVATTPIGVGAPQLAIGARGADPHQFRRSRWLTTIPTRPLQFPSLEHFTARSERAVYEAAQVQGLKPSTLQWAWKAYANFHIYLAAHSHSTAFIGGDVDVQLQVLRGWIAWQRERNISRTTINNRWRGLSSLLRWISDVDGTVNPLRLTTAPPPGRRPPYCLTKEVAESVMEFARNRDWRTELERARSLVILGLMLLAGLRRSEVINLMNGDVDERQGTITVRDGKGTEGGKTRTCYMTPQLRLLVERYKAERRAAHRQTQSFIVDVWRDRGITAEPIRDLCAHIAEGLGIRLTPHVLRHTYATLLRQAGVPDRVSMDLLGHASLSMLQRYSHVFDGEHLAHAGRLVLNIAV
jgi:site-specific recombinase XerD